MLDVTGYADRWSVKPGETIRFMVGVAGGGRYTARVARVQCGDPNPDGPGYRETAVPSAVDGVHQGVEQAVALGSWVEVPGVALEGGAVALVATIWPTLVKADQVVLAWRGAVGSLVLGVGPEGAWCRLDGTLLRTDAPLTERAWHDVACVFDPASGTLSLGQAPHRARLDRVEAAQVSCGADGALAGVGEAAVAAAFGQGHYNGKVERPAILRGATLDAALRREGTVVAAWDFSREVTGDRVVDVGPGGWHGRCHNLPTRAMTGSNWTGREQRWTVAPEQYAAIHFHDDDLGDAGWRVSLALTVPEGWGSGVYALHLAVEERAGRPRSGGRTGDNIVFYVRAAVPSARVAFLAPTFSYTVYGQFQKAGRQALIAARAAAWGALPHAPDGHPEYGVSPYNLHSDGSGVAFASMRRPMIDKRVNQIHLDDPSGSGLYWIAADSYVTDLLERHGIEYKVITDHDVHAEGVGSLSCYQVVLTGQHPEYHSDETMDAIAGFTATGGRLMYLGGNGFYWKVSPHPDPAPGGPWALEVRRAEGGIRLWETLPGEGYHAFDGSYGGLWRRLGRPPQTLVGVGFSAQGEYRSYPYTLLEAITDPRVAFMREGLGAGPGTVFGERGLMGGGAAGHELDRADVRLGTPHYALVVASAVVPDATFQPVNEERRDHTWPGTREELIRSDLVFFETAAGGAVFSVGSMCFIGALPVDGYDNVAARLVLNVVRRFADPAPFEPGP